MNKLYSQIVSLVVIVGLGTAWAFGVIDATLFTTISVTVLSAIFALYQKYEKDEVVKTNLKLEDTLSVMKSNFEGLKIQIKERDVLNDFLNKKVNSLLIPIEKTVSEKPKKVRKPKSS